MILYTPLPYEMIYPTDTGDYEKLKEVNFDGIPLLVELTDDYSCRVIRVLSSDPAHFLNSRYTPGNKIPFFE
jgi:hypothetical protein